MLWNGVLVIVDRETNTLWTQLDGRAIDGSNKGVRLSHRESTFTTWSRWKAMHPDTTVLVKDPDERDATGSAYAEYFADPERLFLPELAEGLGGTVAAKENVFGMTRNGEALAITEALLEEVGVVNAVVGGVPVAWIRDPASGQVRGVERVFAERIVVLVRRQGVLVDSLTGEPLDIDRLPRTRVDRAFWYAWRRSHPGSLVLVH